MYKKIFLLYMLSLPVLFSRAQVSITPQVPPVGVLVKNQLWNMLLVNAGGRVQVTISLVLTDATTNQTVMSASTMPILLDKGARQLQAKDLNPIQYTYNSPSFASNRDPNGMLPIGNYQACYTVYNTIKNAPLAERCVQMAVDPLSPPLLNTPADEGRIYTAWPQFTWLPPSPLTAFSNLSYDLILVEVLPGQGKADAIQQNIPVYSGGLIRNQYMNYPSSYKSLDTGRLYAWRIVALSNGQPAAMSDIWTFRVTTPGLPSLHKQQTPYLDLRRGLDASVATAGTTLNVNYDNTPADTVVTYTIASLQDPGNPVIQQGQLLLGRGQNLLEVTLSSTAGFAEKKIYLFKLVNSRNETWTLKFTPAAKQ